MRRAGMRARRHSAPDEERAREMKSGKPSEIYHYTIGHRLVAIVNEGIIKPATAYVPEGERPAVWFTINPNWDETATKLYQEDDGSLRICTREEMAEHGGGLVRIVVEPKC